MRRAIVSWFGVLVVAACGSSTGGSGGSGGVPCDGPTTDQDCTGATPAKFNCDSASAQQQGIAAGCVSEHPEDATELDLCCPAGTKGAAKTIDCAGPTVDSDCIGAATGKFDCTTQAASDGALAVGCVHEHPNDATDLDVCCPTSVTGR